MHMISILYRQFIEYKKKLYLCISLMAFCIASSQCSYKGMSNEISDTEVPQEYYAFIVNGQRIGYMTESRTIESNRVVTIRNDYRKNRNGEETIYTKEIESLNGEPIESEQCVKTKKRVLFFNKEESKKIIGRRKDNGDFVFKKEKNGKIQKNKEECPGDFLLSYGWDLKLKETELKEGAKFTAKDIAENDPLDIVNQEVTVGPKRNVDLLGETMPLIEVVCRTISNRFGTYTVIVYVDRDANTKKVVMKVASDTLELISCSREMAMGEDIRFTSDRKHVKYTIKSPMKLKIKAKKVMYHIVPDKGKSLSFHESDVQIVRKDFDGSFFVTVCPKEAAIGETFPYQGTDEAALKALRSNELIQSDDNLIVELAQKAVGGEKDTGRAVKKIEKFVYKYMKAESFTGRVSAVEVAKRRRGDCTEYAVLTAALCRAVGIPARVVYGYYYQLYDNSEWKSFWPHAWNEAYVGNEWVGLDATRATIFAYGEPFTALHIAMTDSDDIADLYKDLKGFTIRTVKEYR